MGKRGGVNITLSPCFRQPVDLYVCTKSEHFWSRYISNPTISIKRYLQQTHLEARPFSAGYLVTASKDAGVAQGMTVDQLFASFLPGDFSGLVGHRKRSEPVRYLHVTKRNLSVCQD